MVYRILIILSLSLLALAPSVGASEGDVICVDGFESGYPALCAGVHVELETSETHTFIDMNGDVYKALFEFEVDMEAQGMDQYILADSIEFTLEDSLGELADVPGALVVSTISSTAEEVYGLGGGLFYLLEAGDWVDFYIEVSVVASNGKVSYTGPVRVQLERFRYGEDPDLQDMQNFEFLPKNQFESGFVTLDSW